MKEFKLSVPDMTCGHCEKRIRDAVSAIGGSVKSVDLNTKIVIAEVDVSEKELIAAIDDAGYDAKVVD